MIKVVFTGGGSGGHIVPIVAVARELEKIYGKENIRFFYIGPRDDFGKFLLAEEGIRINYILAGKLRRYFDFKSFFSNIFDILIKTPVGIIQSYFLLFFISPDIIFSKGGYGSIPPVIAGKLLFIPTFLHESDSVPGAANQFLSRLAKEVFASFPKSENFFKRRMLTLGNPIRSYILGGDKEKGKQILNITSDRWVIFVMGGSQGAQRINDKILEILPDILNEYELIFQCGSKNFEQIKREIVAITAKAQEKYLHLFPFLTEEEIRATYSVADIIISRAGSGSIFEIAAAGVPSILIPLPEAAQNHQVKNAYTYAQSKAAIVIEEDNFTPHFVLGKIRRLLDSPEALEKMSENAKYFSRPKAGEKMAAYIAESLKH